jgi:hypothetical protein
MKCALVECGREFTPARSDARYCSDGCKQRAYRLRHHVWEPPELTQEIDDAIALTACAEHALLVVVHRLARVEVAA